MLERINVRSKERGFIVEKILLGKGMTAEVYGWGKDKALKLYFKRIGESWIRHEARISSIVNKSGVPSPAVYGITEVDGRKGIIFERIYGKTMLKHIQKEPLKLYYYAKKLAELQFKIHQYSAKDLPSQKERFETRMKSASKLLGGKTKRILEYIDSLPDGQSVCHGDFHFNNIIVSENGLVPVDWTNAYRGNPLGDVARTCLMMCSPSNPHWIYDIFTLPLQQAKWSICSVYLSEYMRLSGAKLEDIYAWILPVAASKLRDNMRGEAGWLLGIINAHLMQLDMVSR